MHNWNDHSFHDCYLYDQGTSPTPWHIRRQSFSPDISRIGLRNTLSHKSKSSLKDDYIVDPLKPAWKGQIVPLPEGNKQLGEECKRITKHETSEMLRFLTGLFMESDRGLCQLTYDTCTIVQRWHRYTYSITQHYHKCTQYLSISNKHHPNSQSQYNQKAREGINESINPPTYSIIQTHNFNNQTVSVNGNLLAYSVHGETPPPLVSGKTHTDAIFTGPRVNQERREENAERRVCMKPPSCFSVVCTSTPKLYTSTPVADQEVLGEGPEPDLEHFQGALPVLSLCVCGGNQPIEWDDAASDSAT